MLRMCVPTNHVNSKVEIPVQVLATSTFIHTCLKPLFLALSCFISVFTIFLLSFVTRTFFGG